MLKHRMLSLTVMILLITLMAGSAMADRRHFVWTYGYATMPAGTAELEHYFGYKLADSDNKAGGQYSHQLELELGLTDRWDVSLYQMFAQTNDTGFDYDGFKIRTRYRIGEADQYFVDPLLYLEIKRPSDHADPTVVEGKLVLAKSHQKFLTAFNLVVERDLGSGHDLEWKYDIGLGYLINPAFSVGLESKGNFESGDEGKQSFGPTASFAKGSVWFTSGILFPLTDQASDVEFRYILGIYL